MSKLKEVMEKVGKGMGEGMEEKRRLDYGVSIIRDEQCGGWVVNVNGCCFLLPDNYPKYLETFNKQLGVK